LWAHARRVAAVGAREEARHRCCGRRGGVPPLLGPGEEARRCFLGWGRRCAAAAWGRGGGAPLLLGAREEARRHFFRAWEGAAWRPGKGACGSYGSRFASAVGERNF